MDGEMRLWRSQQEGFAIPMDKSKAPWISEGQEDKTTKTQERAVADGKPMLVPGQRMRKGVNLQTPVWQRTVTACFPQRSESQTVAKEVAAHLCCLARHAGGALVAMFLRRGLHHDELKSTVVELA
jgi:hypothetical protein